MSQSSASKQTRASAAGPKVGRLFVLDASGGRVFSMNPVGSDSRNLVTGCRLPDGIAVDTEAGHLYWSDMGVPSRNDGKIERADLDGGNRKTIIPEGATFTPKQIHLDRTNKKLYWSDREGMRVMCANLDGSSMETLIETGRGDADRSNPSNWCVGITVDAQRGHFYWTQKGADNAEHGRIFRAGIGIPAGQTPANRTDVTLLFDGLPEPIDLELDLTNRFLYWTDRGDPPRGNTVNRTRIDGKLQQQIVLGGLMEGIGIALDLPGSRMFVTDLGGSVYSAHLDGSNKQTLAMAQGNLTGIAYAEISSQEK
ncbi:MAG: 3-hydroxyacyl-CoA dehydrogenase [Gammaproteobacteria bacterium]|nr:3-hydroxyacyl-CoA dehydrogenase [Gammaproteobacteria bacterium]